MKQGDCAMDVRVNGVRGVNLAVRDLEQSVRFYTQAWGLKVASRGDDGVVYLRASGPEHHVLSLREAPRSQFLGVSLSAKNKFAVDALHARARGFGADVVTAPQALDESGGGGYGFSFRTPDGIMQTVSCDLRQHRQGAEDKRAPHKFSHAVIRAANYEMLGSFYMDLLGMKFSDETDGITFLRCSPDHHSVALAKVDGPGLHHMAFEVPSLDGLLYAAGHMRDNGYNIEHGPGRHSGPGNNVYTFFIDPNGFAVEYTTEMEQVDDATYPKRSAQWWRENRPRQGHCAWGIFDGPSPLLRKARNGHLIEELNERALAEHV